MPCWVSIFQISTVSNTPHDSGHQSVHPPPWRPFPTPCWASIAARYLSNFPPMVTAFPTQYTCFMVESITSMMTVFLPGPPRAVVDPSRQTRSRADSGRLGLSEVDLPRSIRVCA